MAALRTLDLLVIAIYFAAVACIGLWFARRQTSTEAYFVARRSVPHWAMGLSVFATIISSITFIAYPGAAFKGDWNLLVPGFMAVGVLLVAGTVLIPFFRRAVGMSAYEYFEKRFGYGARAYSALAFAAGHFSKMGFVLFTITVAICGMTHWDPYYVIVGVGIVTILYTLVGGLEAVIWTEVLQGIVKIAGVIVVLAVLISIMPGGAGAAFQLANDHHKFSLGSFDFDLTKNGNFWVMLLYGAFWYLQKYAADQTLVQRYLTAKSDRDALKGVALGAVLCVPAWAAFMLIGTLLWAFYQLSGEALPPQLHDAKGNILTDQVFPYFLSTKIPAGLAGIFMAAMFSAAMSTMSSDLNCLSAVGVEDYYRRLRPNSTDRQRLYMAKIIVAVCGVIAVSIGAFIARKGDSALGLYYAATAIVSAGLAGMFLLAFFSRRANRQGLWIGIVTALVFTAWATLTGGKYKMLDLGVNYQWPDVMIGVIAHIIVLVVGWSASWLFPADANVKNEWTFWGWLEKRRALPVEKIISTAVVGGESMNPITLLQPPRIVFGNGCAPQCAEWVAQRGVKRVLLVSSTPVLPTLGAVLEALKKSSVEVVVAPPVDREPTRELFENVLSVAQAGKIGGVLGIGGGSGMDVAKLVAALIGGKQAAHEVFGINLLQGRDLPLVCLPTTAGTGAEVSPNAILLDETDELKKGVVSPHLVPDAAFVDPLLTVTVPPAVTAATGLDALTHCIEAYANKFAHPIVDTYALQGIRLISANLARAVRNGNDLDARAALALGSLYGGLCLGPVNTAAVHALAYPLGGRFHVAHGVSNALLLPHVLRFNFSAAPGRYAEISVALGVARNCSDLGTAEKGVDFLSQLSRDCGVPQKLSDLKIPRDAIPGMARAAMQVTRLLKNNLRSLTEADATRIYEAAY